MKENFFENNKEDITQAYISKNNSECQDRVIFLMISNSLNWHYPVEKNYLYVKRVNIVTWWWVLLYKLSSFISNKILIIAILKYFVTFADTEFLLQKINACEYNPEALFTTTLNIHTLCGWSFQFTIKSDW